MAGRPKPDIIESVYDDENRLWEILNPRGAYAILYQGEPVSVRCTLLNLKGSSFKYKKMLVNNEGNARLEVKRLNQLFKTEDFSYKQL